ncbi:unnamed protein product [Cercopithifilaria johnstoni]|uniref:Uncharacterized protein n=1 Tax=Cercopithifilaria johnstoni TaxID=2874296 RepID=A0A8J2MK03_9BILA|nr:unnamed protein product [Cercopithifilaria johnstoni]
MFLCIKLAFPVYILSASFCSTCVRDINLASEECVNFLGKNQKLRNEYLATFSNVFLEVCYTRPLFEWIHALMLVLQKSLTHNVCSSIRHLAKHSRVLRNTLNEETQSGSTMHEEFSLFIAVVGVYFEQLDITDQISS